MNSSREFITETVNNNNDNGGIYQLLKEIDRDHRMRNSSDDIPLQSKKQVIEPYMIFDVNHSIKQLKNEVDNEVVLLSTIQHDINESMNKRNKQGYNKTSDIDKAIPFLGNDSPMKFKGNQVSNNKKESIQEKERKENGKYNNRHYIDEIYSKQKPQISSVKKNNGEAYNTIRLLNEQITALIQDNINLQTLLNHKNKEYSKVLQKYKEINNHMDNVLNTTINQLEGKIKELTKSNERLKQSIREKDNGNALIIDAFTKDKDLLIQKLNQMEITKSQLSNSYETSLNKLSNKLKAITEEHDTSKKNYSKQHNENNYIISELQNQLTMKVNEKNELTKELSQCYEQNNSNMLKIQRLNNTNNLLNEEIKELKVLLQDKEKDYKTNEKILNDENHNLIEKVRELSLSDISLISQIKDLEQKSQVITEELKSTLKENKINNFQLNEIYGKLGMVNSIIYPKISFQCLFEGIDPEQKHHLLLKQLDNIIEAFNNIKSQSFHSQVQVERTKVHSNKEQEKNVKVNSNRSIDPIEEMTSSLEEINQFNTTYNSLNVIKMITEDNNTILPYTYRDSIDKEFNISRTNNKQIILLEPDNVMIKPGLSKDKEDKENNLLYSLDNINKILEDHLQLNKKIKEQQAKYDTLQERYDDLKKAYNEMTQTNAFLQETKILNNQLQIATQKSEHQWMVLNKDFLDVKEIIIAQERQLKTKDALLNERFNDNTKQKEEIGQLNTLLTVFKDKILINEYSIADNTKPENKDKDKERSMMTLGNDDIDNIELSIDNINSPLKEDDLNIIQLLISETNTIKPSEIKYMNISNEDKIRKYEELVIIICESLQEERLRNAILNEEMKRLKDMIDKVKTIDGKMTNHYNLMKLWDIAFKDFKPTINENIEAFRIMEHHLKGYNPLIIINTERTITS